MKVLAVVNWLNRGGIEVMLRNSLPWLKKNGIDLDICCMQPGVLDSEFVDFGCAIHRIPKTANFYTTSRYCRRILKQKKYDVVHSHLGYISGGIALAADSMDIPAVISFHSATALSLYHWRKIPGLRQLRELWLGWHRSLMERHGKAFVGHSHINLAAYAPTIKQQSKRYMVIQNGVQFPGPLPNRKEIRRQLGLDDNVLVLLHVGSSRAEKNHLGLLEIFRHVTKQNPVSLLLLVGDVPLGHSVICKARELGLYDKIRLIGLQNDVWPFYVASDVFVFPSWIEGFGNVLVESQCVGLPVVASDIPANHESVAPMQHQFLFPLPRYDIAAEMVIEQAKARAAGKNPWVAGSKQHVYDNFSIERFAADLKQLYYDLSVA
jgi:glycosyltransferase involved in cell wall biosynthesis